MAWRRGEAAKRSEAKGQCDNPIRRLSLLNKCPLSYVSGMIATADATPSAQFSKYDGRDATDGCSWLAGRMTESAQWNRIRGREGVTGEGEVQ